MASHQGGCSDLSITILSGPFLTSHEEHNTMLIRWVIIKEIQSASMIRKTKKHDQSNSTEKPHTLIERTYPSRKLRAPSCFPCCASDSSFSVIVDFNSYQLLTQCCSSLPKASKIETGRCSSQDLKLTFVMTKFNAAGGGCMPQQIIDSINTTLRFLLLSKLVNVFLSIPGIF